MMTQVDPRNHPAPCAIGDLIELLEMPEDPCPIPVGTKGRVMGVQQLVWHHGAEFQIMVEWEIPRSLSMIHPKDKFRVLKKEAA